MAKGLLSGALIVILLIGLLPFAAVKAASFDSYLADLQSDDWKTRRDAVLALGGFTDDAPAVASILQAMLDDADRNVRWAAVQSLIQLGGESSTAVLCDAVNHPQEDVRKEAMKALGKLGQAAESAVPVLIGVLRSNDALKVEAMSALGSIGSGAQAAIPELALLLGDEFRVSMAAKQALAKIDPNADVLEILAAAAQSNDLTTAVRAAKALGGMSAQASNVVPVLIEQLQSPEPEVVAAAVTALGSMGKAGHQAIPTLVALIGSNVPNVRIAVVNTLGTMKAEEELVIPNLAKALEDANADVVKAVLKALRSYGTKAAAAAPQVALVLAWNDEVVRRMANETLAAVDPGFDAGAALAAMLRGDDASVRIKAAAALTQIKPVTDQVVEVLLAALHDPTAGVRMQVAVSLGELGIDSDAVIDALQNAVQDREWEVGWMAAAALSQIAPEKVAGLLETVDATGIPLLLEALMHPELKSEAAERLLELAAQTDLVPSLKESLRYSSATVRKRAIAALSVLGTEIEDAFYTLILALEDANKELASYARETILSISGDESVLATLGKGLLKQDPDIQAAARRLLSGAPLFAATMLHESMDMRIGWPATISPSEPLPAFRVVALADGALTIVVAIDGQEIHSISQDMTAGWESIIELPDTGQLGTYYIKMTMIGRSGEEFTDRFYFTVFDSEQLPAQSSRIAYMGTDGRMRYVPDYKGNRIPDYSHVGYMGGGVALPDVPVKVVLEPQQAGDDTARIQAAIDQVSQLPIDANGFRGAVLLKNGEYRVANPIYIRASGVVLRGEGQGEHDGTVIRATGKTQYNVLYVTGSGSRQQVGPSVKIVENYVPVNATSFTVSDVSSFNVGDDIVVHRPSTQEWISFMGMDSGIMAQPGITPWQPGSFDHYFERKIVNIEGNTITIDVPIMQALEARFGGGEIYKFSWNGRIEKIGVENMRFVSDYAHPTDEEHGWRAIVINNAQDVWVRDVTSQYFGQSLVNIQKGAKRVTVTDCTFIDPVSVMASPRRYSFDVNGAQNLVMRCYSENSRHDFVLSDRTPGPNVFLDGVGRMANSASEPHHRWSVGVLFDNVDVTGPNGLLVAVNRGDSGSGHGWAGGHVVFWNCRSAFIGVMQPPSAQNYAIGVSSPVTDIYATRVIANNIDWVNRRSGSRFTYEGIPFVGDGYFESPDGPVAPRSLYLQQLKERLGEQALHNIGY